MTQIAPLDPKHLEQLQRLTREYARYARDCAGLGTALGGLFLLLVVAADLLGRGWRLTWIGAFAPLPLARALPLVALPFLWLTLRHLLRRAWYQRHGAVEPEEPAVRLPKAKRVTLAIVLPLVGAACLAALFSHPGPARGLRAGITVLLLAALPIAQRGLLHARLERMLGALLFVGPAIIVSGIQMAVEDSLLAMLAVGLAALVLGLREHLAYRHLERRLAALRSVA